LAKPDEKETTSDSKAVERIAQRLDALDRRLDNIDSIVSAVAERVMQQPVTLNITCPRCNHKVEIAIIGSGKPGI
jgi:hypothetical protein